MIEIKGTVTNATVYAEDIEDYAIAQIKMICNNEIAKNSCICVMPDVHPGKVGPIGLTMTFEDAIIPSLVGIDAGCGMTLQKIKGKKIECEKLDTVIRERVPVGFQIRTTPHRFSDSFEYESLLCYEKINHHKAELSMGTLGAGNHFIEVGKDEENSNYIIIHSGSRALGKMVTEYYVKQGQERLRQAGKDVPYELTYVTGDLMEAYLHDIAIVQNYAQRNREAMLDEIAKGMKWKIIESYSCIHNYVEVESDYKILRKGAISAKKGQQVIIPINMRDGIILGVGKGNPDWNYSAPHGSGRVLMRSEVAQHYTVSDYKKEMKGIYSSCISKETLDEAPFAYRRLEQMKDAIIDTVEMTTVLKPIYNYKAGKGGKK